MITKPELKLIHTRAEYHAQASASHSADIFKLLDEITRLNRIVERHSCPPSTECADGMTCDCCWRDHILAERQAVSAAPSHNVKPYVPEPDVICNHFIDHDACGGCNASVPHRGAMCCRAEKEHLCPRHNIMVKCVGVEKKSEPTTFPLTADYVPITGDVITRTTSGNNPWKMTLTIIGIGDETVHVENAGMENTRYFPRDKFSKAVSDTINDVKTYGGTVVVERKAKP